MKAVLVTLLALAASALAGPIIADRQLDTQASAIDSLTEQIKGYTASISKALVQLFLHQTTNSSEQQTRQPLLPPTTHPSKSRMLPPRLSLLISRASPRL